MILKLLKVLSDGFRVMRSNTRLLLVGTLVFIFPLLYISSLQSFYQSAKKSVDSSELRRIGTLHDVSSLYLYASDKSDEAFAVLVKEISDQNPDITEVRIVERSNEGFRVRASRDEEAIGTIEEKSSLYNSAAIAPTDTSFIFKYTLNEIPMGQAIRAVSTPDGTQLFLLTEHSFEVSDAAMKSRLQQSYLGLTAIFLFLMWLAYWISRQIDWQKRHAFLEQKMKERDLFTHMIAHEFRTPLTAINGYTSFLAESTNTSPDEKRYVQTIQLSTGRLLALINDFLEVARIQSGNMQLEMKPVDIQPIISNVLDVLRPAADEKGLTLLHTPLSVPIVHTTDTKRLHQVLQNIISNSIKYTDSGSVKVTTEATPRAVTIRIQDTGMGISAEDQKKLFAPFSRVGGVEKTATIGTGLGMWITKQIVEILGGVISVESIKSVGTHVVITFKR
jgi:signal transduction histidine kinase